jgi:hypothetical protein
MFATQIMKTCYGIIKYKYSAMLTVYSYKT